MPFSSLNKNKNKNKNGFFFAAVFSKVIQSIHNSGGVNCTKVYMHAEGVGGLFHETKNHCLKVLHFNGFCYSPLPLKGKRVGLRD